MEFKTEYKKELNQTKLRVLLQGVYAEDYQVRMIRENPIRGLAAMQARGEGSQTVYEYDITGGISLKKRYRQKKMTALEMQEFLRQARDVVKEMEIYLLSPNRLLFEPEYIFWEEGTYRFCYLPLEREDIRIAFHRLMDSFVQWTDYQDVSSVKTAFLLHRETMNENYSLERIVKKLEEAEKEQEPEKETQKRNSEKEEGVLPQEVLWQPEGYDRAEHDWIARQERGSEILKETDNLWTPVKRLLCRHRRPKWGDWDGIYIDEEEL